MYCHTVVLPDGQIVAEYQNPAVPKTILKEILSWMAQGATAKDVVQHLRLRTVPPGFSPHPWIPGKYLPMSFSNTLEKSSIQFMQNVINIVHVS